MWFRAEERQTFGVTLPRILTFLSISIGATLFEGFGMAMLLPVMEFIQGGQDLAALAENSDMWKRLISLYDFIGLDVTLASLLGGLFLLISFRTVFTYVRTVFSAWLCQDIMHRSRTALFRAYARAEFHIFDKLASGRLVNAATTEMQRFGSYLRGLMDLTAVSIVIIGFIVLLFLLSWSMTLFALGLLGVGGLVVVYFIRHTKKLSLKTTDSNVRFMFMLVERLQAMRLIKLSAADDREISHMDDVSEDVKRFNVAIAKLNARVDLLLEPVVAIAGLVLMFSAVKVFNMSLPQMGLFLLVLLRLMPLAKELLRSRQGVQSVSASAAEVRRMFHEAADIPEKDTGKKDFTGLKEGIRFEGVVFKYPSQNTQALSEVDLFIPAGKNLALVGPSGAGKSTLVDLLPGLRKPTSGRILFDGVEQEKFDLHSLRQGMAFVSQDAFIFNDTVRANLVFTNATAGDEDIWRALREAKAEDFIRSLPQGLDTVLGERGMSLSGGQRQRISLARALIKKAPLLILDEPTSALDSETERDIQLAINKIQQKESTTIVTIAHRLATIRKADKIVVLESGKVSQQGTHEELVVSEEWYKKVSGMQSSESA